MAEYRRFIAVMEDRFSRGVLGYSSVVLAAAGHRADDDAYGRLAKVRFPHHEVVIPLP